MVRNCIPLLTKRKSISYRILSLSPTGIDVDDDDSNDGDDDAESYKKCGMTRAEYVDVQKLMEKLLKNKSLEASVAAGQNLFSTLKSARTYTLPTKTASGRLNMWAKMPIQPKELQDIGKIIRATIDG